MFRNLAFIFVLILSLNNTIGMEEQMVEQKPSASLWRSPLTAVASMSRAAANFAFTPDPNPTWTKTAARTAIGVAGFMIDASNFGGGYGYYLKFFVEVTSGTMLLSAVSDTTYLAYDTLRRPALEQSVSHFSQATRQEKYDEMREKHDLEIARIVRAGKCLLNAGLSLISISKYVPSIYSMIQEGTNPLGFSFATGRTCINGSWSCYPITSSLFLVAFSVACVSELNNLRHFKDPSFPKRGEVPFVKMLNGYNKVGFSASIVRMRGLDPRVLVQLSQISRQLYDFYVQSNNFGLLDRSLYTIIHNAGNFEVYASYVLMGKNFLSYLANTAVIEDITNEKPVTKPRKSIKTKAVKSPFTKAVERPDSEDASSQPWESNDEKYKKPLARAKQKTRGVGDESKSKKPGTTSAVAPQSQRPKSPIFSKRDRLDGLERVARLRNIYPIKAQTMHTELEKAAKFLNGYIEAVDGNEYRIVWSLGERRFAMKFEIPHGKDHTNYAGNKRDRVLSVIEICYLVGLEEAKVQKYVNRFQLDHLFRLDKFAFYVLTQARI